MRVVRELIVEPRDKGHEPEVRVMARSRDGHEVVRTSFYYKSYSDGLGQFRRRVAAAVRWKRPGDSTYEDSLLLWKGAYAGTKMQSCPHLAAIAAAMGTDADTLLESLARGRTVLFDGAPSQFPSHSPATEGG